jgi:hypothetical protein
MEQYLKPVYVKQMMQSDSHILCEYTKLSLLHLLQISAIIMLLNNMWFSFIQII